MVADKESKSIKLKSCSDCGAVAHKCGDWGMWGVRCSNYYECDNVGTMHPKQRVAIELWNEKNSGVIDNQCG